MVRGLGPRLSLRCACARRPRLREAAAEAACSANGTCIRTARSPLTSGQFSDVNPPVHAWASWRVYKIEERHGGRADPVFLEKVFHKLLLNFTWWVNRKDLTGNNIFQGGFLGLDNIGVFDRSAELPTGGILEQSDGTSWMGMYCLNLLEIAMELGRQNPSYEDVASKFFEHFMYIAHAMNTARALGRGRRLLLRRAAPAERPGAAAQGALDGRPDPALRGQHRRGRGSRPAAALPLAATRGSCRTGPTSANRRQDESNSARASAACSRSSTPSGCGACSRSCSTRPSSSRPTASARSRATTATIPTCSPSTARSISVHYEPAESSTGLFGGNSNWRGPIWFPLNFLIIESLQKYHYYYGDDFQVEFPTGSGQDDDALGGRPGAVETPGIDLPPRRERTPTRLRRHRELPERLRTGAT